MGEWNTMQTSSKELHEAIKESLNGLIFCNSQGINMGENNKGKEYQMDSIIEDDLQRALKLSLNPEEQMTKEQRDFVLACKESLVQSKEPPDSNGRNNGMLSNRPGSNLDFNNSMKEDEEVIYLDDDIDALLDRFPQEGLSDIILSHGTKYGDKRGINDKNSDICMNKDIDSAESINSAIECITSRDNSVIPKYSNETGSRVSPLDKPRNSILENDNTSTTNAKKIPSKTSNKKKRKATAAENISKHGNKPIPLAKAAAAAHEAPVLSIQQIQEEERQLQEAIEKSKQDAEALGLSQPLSPTYKGRVSPHIASVNQESDTFQDVSKGKETMSPSFTSAKQFFPGRVSAGAAGTFLADEEKQLREALEISRKELSGNDVHKQAATGQKIPENGANGHIQEVLSNPKKSEGSILNDSLVKKMSEEEQLRYALQLSTKELGIVAPNYNHLSSNNMRDVSMSPPLGYGNALKQASQPMAQRKPSPSKTVANKSKELGKKGQRRPIVIDGCNVAFHHGRHDMFSAQGLKVMYDEFINKGWPSSEIHIFVKPSRMSETDRDLCDSLEKIGVLHWTPTRRVGHQKFTSDDDDMILEYARKKGGVIVTRDQYRDSYDRCPEFKETIEKRLLQFNFINDDVIFPRDPLGKSGPSLEQFLRF